MNVEDLLEQIICDRIEMLLNARSDETLHKERELHEAFRMFDSWFEDNKDIIIVIDEIQESAKVYSRIREFSREFVCHFVVAGSYLGKTMKKGYFLSAGDTENLTLNTLSFEEFVEAFGKRELYNDVDLLGSSNPEQYNELKEYYKIYCEIGGYPNVINCYMETQDTQECKKVLTQIIRTFYRRINKILRRYTGNDFAGADISCDCTAFCPGEKGTR